MSASHLDNTGVGRDAAHTHMSILQGVISRMASNSQSCKTWCVTLVAATFIVAVNTMIDWATLFALVPILLLGGLDMYYLRLERAFRNSYKAFVVAFKGGSDISDDLYDVVPTYTQFTSVPACFKSFSIWLFYSVLAVVTAVATVTLHYTGD